MTRFRLYTIALVAIVLVTKASAQTKIVTDSARIEGTTVVIPGEEYKRSGYHDFFWGKHYRKEWSTPVRVENFFLDKEGLTPYQEGGGRQSTTLRLRNKDGREYVLRSVNKDFGRALPDEAQGTFVSKVAKDQVSIGQPFSAITIAPLAEAAGIYHTNPIIVFVPAQPALGKYNEKFGNQLYVFEERPDENQEDVASLGNAKNIIGTDKVVENVFEDNDHRVDQVGFARARLFDMVIGDWGRHPDNWRWAQFKTDDSVIYKAVPRDRDQAYTKIDGLWPSLAGTFYQPFQGFDNDIKSVPSWNKTGRSLDRMFLSDLDRDQWINEAKHIQNALTDSLISSSVHLLPPEQFAISGNSIIEKLKSRRDHLQEYAKDYYDYLARYVDLTGTQDRELFTVQRMPGNQTEINIYKIRKSGEAEDEPYYSRVFSKKETKEVRIYGMDKKDVVEVKGKKNKGVKVRIIDPGDEDSITFESRGAENRVDVSTGHKYEFDTARQKRLNFTVRPIVSSSIYKIFDRNPLKLFPRTGIKIIGTITYVEQPWRKAEYETTHHLAANYGFVRGAFNLGYVGRFGRLIGKWDMVIQARMDAPAVENYFGTGNESVRFNETRYYYRTFSERAFGSVGVERDLGKIHHIELAALALSIKVHPRGDYVKTSLAAENPSVFQRKNFVGVSGGYSLINVDNRMFPTKGFGVVIGAGYINGIETKQSFVKGVLNSAVFVPFGKSFSMAIRAGGATMSNGDVDYYNLNTIGGGGSGEMRGYDRERFYGKDAAFGNADLRWLTKTRNYLFTGRVGLLAFYDVGRVWQPGEISNTWHGSYGGGIILIPYEKFSVTVTYGVSKETAHINLKSGFFF